MKDLRYKKYISYILTIMISISATIMHEVPVHADADIKLFEYILTLYANMGVGITDETVLSAMQTTMGSGIAIGTDAISTAINACQQALGNRMIVETFASTAESTASYVAEVGASNLAGTAAATAKASENIAASIANYQAYGFVAPVQGGTSLIASAGMGVLAVAAGIGAGIALDKFRQFITPYINSGLGLLDTNLASRYGLGTGAYVWDRYNTGDSPYFFCDRGRSDILIGNYVDSDGPYVWLINNSNQDIYIANFYKNNRGSYSPWTGYYHPGAILRSYSRGTSPKGKGAWGGIYGDPTDYVGRPKPPILSPDIVTNTGNASSNIPLEAPQKEGTPYLEPIPWEVYEPWADAARERTQNGDTGQEQGDDFQDLTDPFWKPQLDPDGIPQGSLTTPAPVYPAQPTYLPMPTEAPNPNPTTNPQVEPAPTLTPEEITQTLEDKTIRNLGSIFPFCIPFDIVDLFRKMDVARKAPVITWDTDFGQWGSFGTITLDMSMFDQAASVARTFELILFIMALMVGTKNLIGWGG